MKDLIKLFFAFLLIVPFLIGLALMFLGFIFISPLVSILGLSANLKVGK